MSTIAKLTHLIDSLEDGGDPTRLFAARAAYSFKHSWLELAQALVEVQNSGRYVEWGYEDFLGYCQTELGIKRTLVDKLTVSFRALKTHAPERLEAPDEEAPIPSYQSLDYFARALGEPRFDGNPSRDAPERELSPELSTQLRVAVFDEGCSPKELRERFDPVIRPKPPGREQYEAARKALSTTRKLLEQLEGLEGIREDVLREAEVAVANLQAEMEMHVEALGARLNS